MSATDRDVTVEERGGRWAVVLRADDRVTRVASYAARFRAEEHAEKLREERWAEEIRREHAALMEAAEDFSVYFNVADELWGTDTEQEAIRLEDLDPEWVERAERCAEVLGLPFPPSLPEAEEYLLDHPEVRS